MLGVQQSVEPARRQFAEASRLMDTQEAIRMMGTSGSQPEDLGVVSSVNILGDRVSGLESELAALVDQLAKTGLLPTVPEPARPADTPPEGITCELAARIIGLAGRVLTLQQAVYTLRGATGRALA